MGRVRRALGMLGAVALLQVGLAACGETRSPIGDECLCGEDSLSGVCSSRTCVAAPPLVNGTGGAPPEETVRIPVGDAGSADAPADAKTEGG